MNDASRTDKKPSAEPEYQAGAACASQAGMTVADLVSELRSAASIVEDAGHEELANKLRNWAICVADAVDVRQHGDRGPEMFVG